MRSAQDEGVNTSNVRLSPPAPAPAEPALTIYYDGACPVCRREIAHYRGLPGAEVCAWVDASQCSVEALGSGLARDAAMRRFHVRLADGQLLQGAPGFAALWRVLPGWQWLGRLAQTWPLRPALAVGYSVFLKVRPLWRAAPPPLLKSSELPVSVQADLRSDHAGELGAVQIYRGVLAVSRNGPLRAFAQRHIVTEARHLSLVESWLPPAQRSHLLPAWRVAGWLTGALPALFGPRAVYATIAAVEQFVDRHYAEQLIRFASAAPHPLLPQLSRELAACQADECAHRDEALELQGSEPLSGGLRVWIWLVDRGSVFAVRLARRW